MKAMPLIIAQLEVDVSFLSLFQEKDVFDETTVQEIMVRMN